MNQAKYDEAYKKGYTDALMYVLELIDKRRGE